MKKSISLIAIVATIFFAASTFANEAVEIKGQFVSLNPQKGSIAVKVEVLGLSGPEKKDMNFTLAKDVKFTVCLSGQCAEKTGIAGFQLVDDYTPFEVYGITPKGRPVIMEQSGNTVTSIRVNL